MQAQEYGLSHSAVEALAALPVPLDNTDAPQDDLEDEEEVLTISEQPLPQLEQVPVPQSAHNLRTTITQMAVRNHPPIALDTSEDTKEELTNMNLSLGDKNEPQVFGMPTKVM